jgi:hypothetical protein
MMRARRAPFPSRARFGADISWGPTYVVMDTDTDLRESAVLALAWTVADLAQTHPCTYAALVPWSMSSRRVAVRAAS